MSARERRPKRKAAAAALEAITGRRPKLATTEASFNFNGVILPTDIMSTILSFLPKPELVHRASLVNSSWCVASENPVLWTCLYEEIWKEPTKANGGTLTSKKNFLELLRRPQFIRLKSLTPPPFIPRTASRNIWKQMGKSCPHLEHIDVIHGTICPSDDDELLLLPDYFPHLKRIDIVAGDYVGITQDGVSKFLKRLGESLVELNIYGAQVFSSETLGALGKMCPNLKVLFYIDFGSTQIGHQAVIEVINTCGKLEEFTLSFPREDSASMDVSEEIFTFMQNHGEEYPMLDMDFRAHDLPLL